MKTLKNLFSLLNPFTKSKRVKTNRKKSKKGTKRVKRRQIMKGG